MIVRCHCCGKSFSSKLPQDWNRDKGFGTCDECWKWLYRNEPNPPKKRYA